MLRNDLIERIKNAFNNKGISEFSDILRNNMAYNVEDVNKTDWRLNPTLRFDLIWTSARSSKGYKKLGICWIYPGDNNIQVRLQKAFSYEDLPFIRAPSQSDMQGYWRFSVYDLRDVNYIGDIIEWYIIPKMFIRENLFELVEIEIYKSQIADFVQYVKYIGYDEYKSYTPIS